MTDNLSPEVRAVFEESLSKSQRQKVFNETLLGYKEAETEELKEKLHTDSLTQVLNREGFKSEVLRLLEEQKEPGAILFIDIDNFKKINTDYGEPGGDEALFLAAQALKEILRTKNKGRQPDVIGRWGGEEFVVYLPGSSAKETLSKLKKGRLQKIEDISLKLKPIKGETPEKVKITFSGGISDFDPTHSKDLEKDLEDAVNATSLVIPEAKKQGKDRIIFLDTKLA